MFDKRMFLLLMICWAASVLCGCEPTFRREQQVVSQLPYARPPALIGPGSRGSSRVRVGGSADFAAIGPDSFRAAEGDGSQLVPVGVASGYIAVELVRNFEVGLSGGAYFAQRRATREPVPLTLPAQPLGFGAVTLRFLIDTDAMVVAVGGEFGVEQARYSWLNLDTCLDEEDCGFMVEQTTTIGEMRITPRFSQFVELTFDITDWLDFSIGASVQVMSEMPTRKQATCRFEHQCLSKPPEPAYTIGMVPWVGLTAHLGSRLRAKVFLQPITSFSARPAQYLNTRVGIEALF